MKIFVGNLSLDTTDEELRSHFSAFGQVLSAEVVKDRFTAKSRGFGFVEMPTRAEAEAAIAALNGKELKGRPLTVNEARPRPEGDRGRREGRGGWRGGRQGGGGGRGGFRGGGSRW